MAAGDGASPGGPVPLRVASWNIHRCIGSDGRHDPDRVARVIQELDADVIGLQEVDSRYHGEHGLDQIEYLAQATGLGAISGPTLERHEGRYGNGLLTRRPILGLRRFDLSVSGREPRGALDVELSVGGARLRVVVTHFGLRARERRAQVERLLAELEPLGDRLLVVLGDFNEWQPGGAVVRTLDRHLGVSRAFRTFPARWPLLALDRIWVRPRQALHHAQVHRSALARQASDHLPVKVRLDPGVQPAPADGAG